MRGRHLGCVPLQSPPFTYPHRRGGGGRCPPLPGQGRQPNPRPGSRRPRPRPPGFLRRRAQGGACGPRAGCALTPALRRQSPRSGKEGNPRTGEPGMRRRGRGAGDVERERGGAGGGEGAGTRHWLGGNARGRAELGAEAPPRGGSAAGPVIRLAARPGPAQRQGLGESPPLLPCPGLEPSPARVAGDGAGAAAASRPHLPRPSHPRWTSGPGPRADRAPEALPARPRGPARAARTAEPPALLRPDFRLPLDAPSGSPPSPPRPAWSGGRREGGRAPCCVPAPPRPP